MKIKKELIYLELREPIQAKKKKDLFELSGKIKFHEGYDHRSLRSS